MRHQEVNLTDAGVFEREIQHAITTATDGVSVFIADMGGIGKLFKRSGNVATKTFMSTVAKLLARMCRDGDRIYRVGQFTFAVVLTGTDSPVLQQLAAEKITRLYKAAVSEVEASFNIDISIGIASYPEHADNAAELIRNATMAAEAAHSSGDPYFMYHVDLMSTMTLKWSIQDDLATAIAEKSLDVVYQPKLSVATGRPVGAEALVRWSHEQGGAVPPSVFVPVACDIGMIDELTNFVLMRALNQAAEWPDVGQRCSVAVNVEAQALQDSALDDVISRSLSIWGGDCVDLIVEITESALVIDSKSNFKRLEKLRSRGIGISIDDFGTGYSSLSYFRNIPASELKIDRQFVANMLDQGPNRNLVETIVGLGHQFGLTVVAEGVENVEQFEILSEIGCDVVQGFHISGPLSHEDYCRWLEEFSRDSNHTLTATDSG